MRSFRLGLLALLFALPALGLERTWQTSPNNALDSTSVATSSKNQLWFLGAGPLCVSGAWGGSAPGSGCWTMWCSSDGTTAPSDNCSTDHTERVFGSSYNAAKFVRNAAGAHTYWVLKSPTYASNNYYMIVDYNTASDQTVSIQFSKTAPTCAGNCTTSTAPTAADVWTANAATGFNGNSITTTNRAHFSQSTTGDFWMLWSRDASGFNPGTWISINFIADYLSGTDTYPLQTCAGRALSSNISTGGNWTDTGVSSNIGCQTKNGAGTQTVSMFPLVYYTQAGGTAQGWNPSSSGRWNTVDNADSKWHDLPIYVASTRNAAGMSADCSAATDGCTLRGRLVDIRWAPFGNASSLATGTTGPSTPPYTVIHVNGAWLPWVTSTAPTL